MAFILILLPFYSGAQLSLDQKLLKNSKNDIESEAYIQELIDSSFKSIKHDNKEQALNYVIEAIHLFSQINLNVEGQIRINEGLGGALAGLGAYSYAIYYSKRSIKLLNEHQDENYFRLVLGYGRVGSLFLFQNEADSALYYFRKTIPLAIKNGDHIFIASAYNNLGIAYSKINEDSALYHFNFAKTTLSLTSKPDRPLMTSINDNLADLYFENERYQLAEPLYEWNYHFLKEHPKYRKRTYAAGYQLANIYLKTNQLQKFKKILNDLKQTGDSSNYLQSRQIFQIEGEYYRKTGQTEMVLKSLEKEIKALENLQEDEEEMSIIIQDRLNDLSVKRIEKELELEKLKTGTQENQLALSEQKSINRLTWIWTSILSGILIIIILYLNYRKKIEGKKREQEQLDNELALKKRDLEDFAMEIMQKQDWTDKLSEKLVEIKNLEKEEVSIALRSLLNEVKGTQLAAKQKKVFQQNIAQVNHSFFEKLNQQFGQLTKSERELAGLLRMDLSNKEIANLRNMEVSSVKRGRNRLRKKLNLNPNTDIYTFLKSI